MGIKKWFERQRNKREAKREGIRFDFDTNRTSKELSLEDKLWLKTALVSAPLTQDEREAFLEIATYEAVRNLQKLVRDSKITSFKVVEETSALTYHQRQQRGEAKGNARYLIIKEIGAGGQGKVNAGYDMRLGRLVALKTVDTDDEQKIEFAKNEAQQMADITGSDDVLQIYDFHMLDNPQSKSKYTGTIVMEYMDLQKSHDLTTIGTDKDLLPPEEIGKLATTLGRALNHYHKKGIRHLDVKPSNIFKTERGYKLTDFGIASSKEMFDDLIGTPTYAAPELWLSEKITPATEVWSTALTILFTMTGKRLFSADAGIKDYDLAKQNIKEKVVGFDSQNGPGAAALLDLVMNYCQKFYPNEYTQKAIRLLPVFQKALRSWPQDRYQSVPEFSKALSTALGV